MVRPSSLLMVSATQSNDVSYIVIIHIAAKACFHHHHHQNHNTLLSKGCRACLCMSMQHHISPSSSTHVHLHIFCLASQFSTPWCRHAAASTHFELGISQLPCAPLLILHNLSAHSEPSVCSVFNTSVMVCWNADNQCQLLLHSSVHHRGGTAVYCQELHHWSKW